MIPVRLSRLALSDLENISDYYEERDVPDVGRRLIGEILEKAEMLGDFPDLGRMVPEFGHPRLRELIHPPFRIVYRREEDVIKVVRVWRSERQLTLPDEPI